MDIIVKRFNELKNEELYEILKARSDIFVVEQKSIYSDMDNKDQNAIHIMIKEDGRLCGYCRVLDKNVSFDTVSIGRVITTVRKKGYGRILIEKAIEAAKEVFNGHIIKIEAQVQALDFYHKFGFEEFGDTFLEDGILHINMKWKDAITC